MNVSTKIKREKKRGAKWVEGKQCKEQTHGINKIFTSWTEYMHSSSLWCFDLFYFLFFIFASRPVFGIYTCILSLDQTYSMTTCMMCAFVVVVCYIFAFIPFCAQHIRLILLTAASVIFFYCSWAALAEVCLFSRALVFILSDIQPSLSLRI